MSEKNTKLFIIPIIIGIQCILGVILPVKFSSSLGIAGVILITLPISYIFIPILFFRYGMLATKYKFIYPLFLCTMSIVTSGFIMESISNKSVSIDIIRLIYTPSQYLYFNIFMYLIGYIFTYIKTQKYKK